MTTTLFTERKAAVMQRKQGKTIEEVAQSLNRSVGWVSKWERRYQEEGWKGLKGQSRAPKNHVNKTTIETKAAICHARMELEMEAELGNGLKYIGARAVRTRLKQEHIGHLPSVATIERILREADLTKERPKQSKPEI